MRLSADHMERLGGDIPDRINLQAGRDCITHFHFHWKECLLGKATPKHTVLQNYLESLIRSAQYLLYLLLFLSPVGSPTSSESSIRQGVSQPLQI